MTDILVFIASAAVFCALQAVYWLFAHRRGRADEVLADRLGGIGDSIDVGGDLIREAAKREGWLNELSILNGVRDLLEEAGEDGNVSAFVGRMVAVGFGGFAFFILVMQDLVGAMVLGFVAAGFPYFQLLRKKSKRMERIQEQLPEALEVMIISLRAGQSLEQTIRTSASQLRAPIRDEFVRVADEQGLGRPLEEALVAMSLRLQQARTVRTFVVSVLVLRQTGGNLIEVLESIIDTMRAQTQYERKLRAMTAEGRSSSRMLALLPPAFATLSYVADPGYIGRLLTDPLGQMMLMFSVSLWLLGVIWVRKLVSPKN